jgi:hypothetical protein
MEPLRLLTVALRLNLISSLRLALAFARLTIARNCLVISIQEIEMFWIRRKIHGLMESTYFFSVYDTIAIIIHGGYHCLNVVFSKFQT